MSSTSEDSKSALILSPVGSPDVEHIGQYVRMPLHCQCEGSSTSIIDVSTCWNGDRICNECRDKFDDPSRCSCRKIWISRVRIEDDLFPVSSVNNENVLGLDSIESMDINCDDAEPQKYGEMDDSLKFGPEGENNAEMCDVCGDVSMEDPLPIYTCVIGHHICSHCHYQLEDSSVCICKQPWSTNDSLVGQSDSDTERVECIFKTLGCHIVTGAELRYQHCRTCKYRPIWCNFKTHQPCHQNPILVKDYLDHLKMCHLLAETKMEQCGQYGDKPLFHLEISSNCSNIQISYMVYDDKQFLLHFLLKDGNLNVWAAVLDNIDDLLKDYNIFVAIQGAQINFKMVWCLPVNSPYLDENEIFTFNGYVTISNAKMLHFPKEVNNCQKLALFVWIAKNPDLQ